MKVTQITFYALSLLLVSGIDPLLAGIDSTSTPHSVNQPVRNVRSQSTSLTDSVTTEYPMKLSQQNAPIDSSSGQREQRRTLLERLLSERSSTYNRADTEIAAHTPYTISGDKIFRSDKTSPSELLQELPSIVSVPFGLSSSLSRALFYGNPAPLTPLHSHALLTFHPMNPLSGTDQKFLTETAALQVYPGSLSYQNPSNALSVPEVLILWENGVFDENILNVRFSRPFARTLTAHFISNYRYFKGKSFNHRGNDVYYTFRSFQDSSVVSEKGYNPLVNERHTGTGLHWADRGHALNLSVNYGEFNNEVALDIPGDIDKAVHAMYYRYPLTIQGDLSLKLPHQWFFHVETQFHNEPIVRITGENSTSSALRVRVRKDALEQQLGGALQSGVHLFSHDSAGFRYSTNVLKRKIYNDSESVVIQHRPALYYQKHITTDRLSAGFLIKPGITLSAFKDSITVSPQWHVSGDASIDNKQFRMYAQQDIVPFVSENDSLTSETSAIDTYFRTGCELYADYTRFNLCIGYQYTSGIDSRTVANAWPSGTPPYKQPQSAVVIAPALSLNNQLQIKTRVLISDEKPYVKTSGQLNYSVSPANIPEHFDFTLYAEYWSERDPVTFAGRDDWNTPIFNTGLEIAAHIKSFRLFYKIDNIFNRKFAYVPGYYSPGITFRWGFNWFIQR